LTQNIPANKILFAEVKLTTKQKQFVKHVMNGISPTESYIMSYDTNGNKKIASTEAYKLMSKPKITKHLEQQNAINRLRYSQNPNDIRDFVIDNLQHEARTADKTNDRLRALELLGKLADVAAFEHKTVIEHRREDTLKVLQQKLARIVQNQITHQTIDVLPCNQSAVDTDSSDGSLHPAVQSLAASGDTACAATEGGGTPSTPQGAPSVPAAPRAPTSSINPLEQLASVGGGGEFLEGAEENENLTGENSDKEVRDCLEPGGAIWKDPVKWYAHHVKDIETSVDIAEFRRRFWSDAVTK
jgi:hypothetical protein